MRFDSIALLVFMLWGCASHTPMSIELHFGNYGNHIEGRSLPEDTYYPGKIQDLKEPCTFVEEPLWSANPSTTISHFRNMSEYSAFDGRDLTPWNHNKIPPLSSWQKLKQEPHKEITLSTCDISRDKDNNQWTIQRLGPFISEGCYDWWQFASHDFLGMSRHLKAGQIQLSGHYVVGSDEQGNPLPYPPIHIHHIHVVPEHKYLRFQWPFEGGHLSGDVGEVLQKVQTPLYVPVMVLETHGEWDSCHSRNAPGCFWEQYPEGFGMTLERPMDFEGEVNDARACHAEPMTWYLEIGARWSRPQVVELKPLSKIFLLEGHVAIQVGNQSTYENYFWTPTEGKGFNWYSYTFPLSGNLLRTKHHNHMTSLNRTLLLKGTPEQLGLHSLPDPAGVGSAWASIGRPVQFASLAAAGMSTFDDLEAHMITSAQQNGIVQPVICTVHSGTRQIGDYWYDYPGAAFCNPTRVKAGEPYTSISFHEYLPEEKPVGPWMDKKSFYVPNHNEWFIMLDTEDEASHSRLAMGVCGKVSRMGGEFVKLGDFMCWHFNVHNGITTRLQTKGFFLVRMISKWGDKIAEVSTHNLLATITIMLGVCLVVLFKVIHVTACKARKLLRITYESVSSTTDRSE